MTADLAELERQMAEAHLRGDRRAAGVLADQILRSDLLNPAAWEVIYWLMNSNQPMEAFQRWVQCGFSPAFLRELMVLAGLAERGFHRWPSR